MIKNEHFKIHFNVSGKNIWDYHKNYVNCFQSSGFGSQWYLNIFLILLLISIFIIQFRCLPQLQEFQSKGNNNLLGKQMRSAKPFFPLMTEKKGIIQILLKVGFYIYSG